MSDELVIGNVLLHYGVKGMKWGVRKEYEVKGRSKSNKSKKDKVLDFETDLVKTKVTINGTDTIDDYKNSLKNQKLTERTNFYMPGPIASMKFQNLPKTENRLSNDLEAQKVNDPTESKKRNTNCFQCTIAYEMRMRGYDVQSNTNYGGHNYEYLHAFDVKDSFRVKSSSKENATTDATAAECFNRISAQCLEYGDGARGAITMTFPLGGGHVMNWVVEDGEFKLIDAQHEGQDGYETFSNSKFDVEVFRLDNAELLPGCTDFVESYKASNKSKSESKISKLAKKIGKNVSKFVSTGLNFVKNFFKKAPNVKPKEPKLVHMTNEKECHGFYHDAKGMRWSIRKDDRELGGGVNVVEH